MLNSAKFQSGTTMLEVLITIVIIAIGLLGLAGLQSRLQVSEMEAYQRAQGLILLDDMASRIATNRNNAASYATTITAPLGTNMTCPGGTSRLQVDVNEWCNLLQGAAELSGGSKIGTMVGARGCVESAGAGQYMVTVAWQGFTAISAPPASVTCGQGLYNGAAGSSCVNDLCRRVLTTIVRIATLT